MRPWRTILVLLLLAPLSACLDVDTRILVTSDGSGTLTERFELKGPMAAMLQQMDDGTGGFADRQKVEEHAKELGEGVRVLSVNPLAGSEAVGAVAVFAFEDVTKLTVRQNPVEGRHGAPGGDSPPAAGTQPAEMKFRFEPGRPAVLTVVLSRDAGRADAGGGGSSDTQTAPGTADGKPDPMAEKMLAGIREMLKGMRMAISVEVDGRIVETNATYRDGNRLTLLELEVDRLLEADPDSAAVLTPGGDVEAMKKAIAKVPGVKVELEPEVRIVFTPGTVLASTAATGPRATPGSL